MFDVNTLQANGEIPMSKQKAYVSLLLDRSGSMQVNKAETISAISQYIAKLKESFKGRFTMTQFDSGGVDVTIDGVKIKDIPEFTDFTPRGGTPLLDAIGKTIHAMDADEYENVIFVIVTDGGENSSHEYTLEAVRNLIEEKTKAEWQFLFLGADMDAFGEASNLGIASGQTLNYSGVNASAAMTATIASNTRYATRKVGKGIDVGNFTGDERKAAS